jgi:hypothetical protein
VDVDFAETYRKLSTEDLERLGREAAGLRPEAKLCLEAELRNRSSVAELEPIRVTPSPFAEGDVVVRGTSLRFPHLCPSCLHEAPTKAVKIRSSQATSYRVIYVKYRSYVFAVPFCDVCARRINRYRIFETSMIVFLVAITRYFIGSTVWSILLSITILLPLLWLARRMGLRDDPGIAILSDPNDPFTHLRFSHPEYAASFQALNRPLLM